MKSGFKAWPQIYQRAYPRLNDAIDPTRSKIITAGTTDFLIIPDLVSQVILTGVAGGGGGGCSSGGAPSPPTPGGDTNIWINDNLVFLLKGGNAGTNNIGSTVQGGSVQFYPASAILGMLTRQINNFAPDSRFVSGATNSPALTGGKSQFGTSSGGYGYGGDAASGAGGGAGGGALDLYPLPVIPGQILVVSVGLGGIRGIGDTQGQNGGPGIMIIQW